MRKLPPFNAQVIETEVLRYWKKNKTFQRSLELRKGAEQYTFYDGPPFANGLPHYGHILASSIKDAITRLKTMQGYYVPRRLGWDTHGLPVEYEIEKQLGISGKPDIEKMGIDKFNQACRNSVFTYKKEWEELLTRLGRWADQENAYATLDTDYIESVWWVFKQIHDKGLVYRGFRSMPYCPRCGTPLSNFEVNLAYQDNVKDPSLYVKFELVDQPGVYFLAWTTTPWSLPGNEALALDADTTYVKVKVMDEDGEQVLILAKTRLGVLDAQYSVLESYTGKELAGKQYKPVYKYPAATKQDLGRVYQTRLADFVSLEDGTGIVHVAPAFGEDDLNLAAKHDLPVWLTVDGAGKLTDETDFAGLFVKKADNLIIADLTRKGLVFAAGEIHHTYPYCWRCDTPLIYYAVSSWNIAVSKLRKQLVESNSEINWVPKHIKEGRFGNWLADARDWGVSRNRYWGAPLPIWVNDDDPDDYIVIGSIKELAQRAGKSKVPTDLHRPQIDLVVIESEGKTYRRVSEVFDCWFESGAMPYAQVHYPFKNKTDTDKNFPADFIAEGLDQTRGWFYTLHVLATILFDKPAFKNVAVNGLILAPDGKKLSKRLRNYPEPGEIMEKLGADSLRFFLLSSPATMAEDVRFSYDHVATITRNQFMTLYNSASFFSMYAEVDNWRPGDIDDATSSSNPLDKWMIERVKLAVSETNRGVEKYELPKATRPIADLIDDVSNWYIRRSRRRFWKSDNDTDKEDAFKTLHWTLLMICQLLAPWAPFLSDYLYVRLTDGIDGGVDSVHLTDWPKSVKFDQEVLKQMDQVRAVVTEGLSQRAEAGIKVRQPLARVLLRLPEELPVELTDIIADELNVKIVEQSRSPKTSIKMNTKITQELQMEGFARDLIRLVQASRKESGLNIEDRIDLSLGVETEFAKKAITTYHKLIAGEVLATKLDIENTKKTFQKEVKIGQTSVIIHLQKS